MGVIVAFTSSSVRGVSKICAINNRADSRCHFESKRSNEHKSGNTSV
jgi:hypothetical protein